MGSIIASLLGGLLRAAPYLICIFIGWQAKTTLVDLAEARQESAELKKAKEERDTYEKQLKEIRKKYEKLDASSCTRELSDCASNHIDKLFQR